MNFYLVFGEIRLKLQNNIYIIYMTIIAFNSTLFPFFNGYRLLKNICSIYNFLSINLNNFWNNKFTWKRIHAFILNSAMIEFGLPAAVHAQSCDIPQPRSWKD